MTGSLNFSIACWPLNVNLRLGVSGLWDEGNGLNARCIKNDDKLVQSEM